MRLNRHVAPTTRFLDAVAAALGEHRFQRLVFGGPVENGPRRVEWRPVILANGAAVQQVTHENHRDVTRNVDPATALASIRAEIAFYRNADLFTEETTLRLEVRAGRARLRQGPPTPIRTSSDHNRAVRHPVDLARAPWMVALGAVDRSGHVVGSRADKIAQVQRFADLLGHAVDDLPRDRPLRLVDLGCGKGWLTFAARDVLTAKGFTDAHVTGVDRRADLVAAANNIAASGIVFQAGEIAAAPLDGCDVVVALHACDTATDDAIARAIEAHARRLLIAPCCHREVRPGLSAPPALVSPFRHGLFVERQAEWLTDALRAALLGAAGYGVTVAEFVPTDHTPRNLLLTAARSPGVDRAARRAEAISLAAMFSLREQTLARHLGVELSAG